MSEEQIRLLEKKLKRERQGRKQAETLLEQKSLALYEQNTELDLKREALERSNKELEQFAFIASHDLRAPLRGIVSFTTLLKNECQGKVSTQADEYFKFIEDSGTYMMELIDDLLTFTSIGSQKKTREDVDLGSVVSGVCERLQHDIQTSQTEVVFQDLPTVPGDAVQLGQLFQNLIANAMKFRRTDCNPRIEITATEQEGGYEISVRDNGIGIEPDYSRQIFQVFTRLHTSDKYEGTGIGLSICKKVVEEHGGHIRAEPHTQGGSLFIFTLSNQRELMS